MKGELAGRGVDDPTLQRVRSDQSAVVGIKVGGLEESGVARGAEEVLPVGLSRCYSSQSYN